MHSSRLCSKGLRKTSTPTLQIGYEELVLYTREIIPSICDFLGIDDNGEMYSLGGSKSHIICGNPMRNQEDKRQAILYDNRWLHRDDWLLPSLLLRNVMRYNSREVYRNLRYTRDEIVRST